MADSQQGSDAVKDATHNSSLFCFFQSLTEHPISVSPNSTTATQTSTGTSQTTANLRKTQNPTAGPGLASASKTVTVSGGQTGSAQVGWMVVGVGVGGSVSVGGNILPAAGGTGAIIEDNSSGQDELSTISSTTSSTSSSSSASPTSSPKQNST